MDAVHEALGCLAMTQCPYYLREEKCASGCYAEPACRTDEPSEGWVKAALTALEGALPADLEQAS